MSTIVYELPWYATGLRADKLAAALQELTPKLLELGALDVRVLRARDDAYRFRQSIVVPDKTTWARLWNSETFVQFRATNTSFHQKPLNYEIYAPIAHARAEGLVDPFGDEPFGPAKAEEDPRISGQPVPTQSG
ncbi:hypothetical protein ACVU7I_12980 [Patulibacter sp. S7RM1-6]